MGCLLSWTALQGNEAAQLRELQATDRAYRIGQTQRVLVHKFITSGSLEEKIDRMIQEKASLAADIIGSGEEWLGGLELTQLRSLVSLESSP